MTKRSGEIMATKLGESPVPFTAEEGRRQAADEDSVPWRKWGPYLAERQWGTVREDYSTNGDAWSYLTHDQARSRAYRWGEDGIAGISDDQQRMCLSLVLWNGVDPILKERLFGLTNSEGNHGEDVKEYYFFVDATPTHSYLRELYKYPQREYPYADLVATNRARSRDEMEYELLDTGIFDEDRYFDVEIEYAKAGPEDLLMRVTAHNRGPEPAPLHLLPTVWFRNTWWQDDARERPQLRETASDAVLATHPTLGSYRLLVDDGARLLFCENETNAPRVFGAEATTPYPKDGINDHVVHGQPTVNPAATGTKVAAHWVMEVPAGGSVSVRIRLLAGDVATAEAFGAPFDALVEQRRAECDEFYEAITPEALDADRRSVMRQALAGMIWSKQYYEYDVDRWLAGHGGRAAAVGDRIDLRNEQWAHMDNRHVLSMPDTWEYPWYAAWDLAFHVLPLAIVDPAFARRQVELMLSDAYLHPSGQLPAYEWNFGDVNPPVHAFATLFIYFYDKDRTGTADVEFLRKAFHKLLLVFTWWVNRKDPSGRSVFEGGFLGLDNIGVFDRSSALPTGGRLEQADGSAWMGFFSLNMLEMAIELADHEPSYDDYVLKFLRHFLQIASAMDREGDREDELWDAEDGFFYDVLRLPDGSARRLKVRSMVGLLPLTVTATLPRQVLEGHPELRATARERIERHRELLDRIADPLQPNRAGDHLLSAVNEEKLRAVVTRMVDEERFLSPHGLRALSRWHLDHPYEFDVHGARYVVAYEPAESTSGMFGGNSNWRGPVWMPVNTIVIRALFQLASYYGDDLRVEYPSGSGVEQTLGEIATDLAERVVSIFTRDAAGRRPVYGGSEKFQTDPHWRDLVLFYEYFHGDNGAGLGASHQTGWTGLVAVYLQLLPLLRSGAIDPTRPWPLATHYRRPLA
ncbi:MAG TPA: glucosidase [Actinomycetes bacterium]